MRYLFTILASILLVSCAAPSHPLNALQGMWAPAKDENVAFTIKGNTIQYFEQKGLLDIKLEGDALLVMEEGHELGKWHVLKATKDSLVLKTEDGTVQKYIKRKS